MGGIGNGRQRCWFAGNSTADYLSINVRRWKRNSWSPRINPFWYSSICANFTTACYVSRFPAMSASRVRPIRTEQDHASAPARIEALMDRERSPTEDDEFDTLATLVDPIEATEFRIGQQ